MLNYPIGVRNKNSECGWIYVFCVPHTTGAVFRRRRL